MNTTTRNGKWTFNLAAKLCAIALVANVASGAAAQPSSPIQPAASQAVSIDQALAVAQQWLALSDADQAAVMWEQASHVMKSRISRAAWAEHVAALRSNAGQVAGQRTWTRMEQELNAPNLPPGRFMGIQFIATFAKAPRVVEMVSLIWEGGRWVPVGYQFGSAQVAQTPAQPQSQGAAPASK